jgi:hypothetical protein
MMFRNRWNVQPTARKTPSGGTAGSKPEEVRNVHEMWRSRHGVKRICISRTEKPWELTEDRQDDLEYLRCTAPKSATNAVSECA